MNLIEIGPVVIEIQGVKNGKLVVPVNNTLVRHVTFLAADTLPCVLMMSYFHVFNSLLIAICLAVICIMFSD